MAAILRNNANGGTNGATVTYYNAGETSGDQWSYISYGTGMTISFSNTVARGGMAYKCSTTGTASQGFMNWNRFPESPNLYVRFAMYIPSIPSASVRPCELDDGTAVTLSIGVNTSGKLSIRDSAAASMATSATTVPVGRWFRVELHLVSHATAGQMDLRLYTDVDSPYPAEKITSAASFNTKPNPTYTKNARFGISSSPISNWTHYLDDIAISDTTWLGPADAAATAATTLYNGAEMGSNTTAVTVTNSGDAANHFLDVVSSPSTAIFSSAQSAHGSLSYFVQPTSGNVDFLSWGSLATQSAACRAYLYMPTLPSVTTEYVQLTTTDTASFDFIARLAVSPAGKVLAYDNGTSIWTSTATLSVGTWYRFELFGAIGASSTTGTLQAAIYAMDSTTALDSFSTTSANTGAAQAIGMFRAGKCSNTTSTSTLYFDDVAVQQAASGFIGPYSGPPSAPATFSGIIPHLGWGRAV